jgi:hypothetical protein
VYVGAYFHKDGSTITLRDAIRLANVLLHPDSISKALNQIPMGHRTSQAANMLGEHIKKELEEMRMWTDVDEYVNFIFDMM